MTGPARPSDNEKSLKVSLAVSTQYTSVTDRQTDTAQQQRPHYKGHKALYLIHWHRSCLDTVKFYAVCLGV